MRVRFDPSFDGGAWPGPLGTAHAVAGEAWLGFAGLLGLLETRLGLRQPFVTDAERAARLIPGLRAIEGFWSRSCDVDPLGAARRILTWRDELYLEGWAGEPLTPTLRAIATATSDLPPGVPDRLRRAVDVLRTRHVDIDQVQLFCPVEALPQLWRRVFAGLKTRGTQIVEAELRCATSSGDVSGARESGFSPAADGSLQLVRPGGYVAAAAAVADWLAAFPADERSRALIIGADAVLDRALQERGLPTMGGGSTIDDDALLQILPLTLAMGWSPPDPHRALELLTLPCRPVPPSIARGLVGALHQWPAVDSDAWRDALADRLSRVEDADQRERHRERIASIFSSTARTRYPIAELRVRLALVRELARQRVGSSEDYGRVLAQCASLERLVDAAGLSDFSAPQLRRFVQEATRTVSGKPSAPEQAGFRHVSSPEAVCGPAAYTVWWGFSLHAAPSPRMLPLALEDLTALRRAGVSLPDPSGTAVRNSRRWARPLEQTERMLLCVCPARDEGGAELFPHPLWDEVAARVPDDVANRAELASLTRPVPWHPQPLPTTAAELVPLPAAVRHWSVPRNAIAARETESPSSVATLLGCSLQWVLRYAGQVRGGATARLPEAKQLLGSTAHEIVARVLKQGPATPEAGATLAARLFDEEGPRMAAPLFQPGADATRAQAKQVTVDATRELLRLLEEARLEVCAVEEARQRSALGATLEGTPDLVVTDAQGRRAVIDLKWSGATYRRDSLKKGTAHQLAAYSFLLSESQGGALPATAYFILSRQQLLSTDPVTFPGAVFVQGPNAAETWKALGTAHGTAWKQVQAGRLEAAGVVSEEVPEVAEKDEVVEGTLRLSPPCDFCEYEKLCGRAFEGGVEEVGS